MFLNTSLLLSDLQFKKFCSAEISQNGIDGRLKAFAKSRVRSWPAATWLN